MIVLFAIVFIPALLYSIYRAYLAASSAVAAVAPQEAARFFTLSSIRDPTRRMASRIFHISIITVLAGHFFIFVDHVPQWLSTIGTTLGAVALGALLVSFFKNWPPPDRQYIAVVFLTAAVIATGLVLGAYTSREEAVAAARGAGWVEGVGGYILAAHVISAAALAAFLPFTLINHVTAPLVYLLIRQRSSSPVESLTTSGSSRRT
ncbi:MAG: hypothetical protein QXE80_07540 [Pyrobaculum sp.]